MASNPKLSFSKLTQVNNKLVRSKAFILVFTSLVLFVVGASGYLIMTDPSFLDFSGKQEARVSEEKYKELEKALNEVIVYSKDNPIKAISALENYGVLPKKLNDRKLYILSKLYSEINETALAFISADSIDKKYIPKYSKLLKAGLAKKIGLEGTVVESYKFLSNKFHDVEYKYELAKSYLRQNLKEESQKLFELIQKDHPESEFATGADYYLANLSHEPVEKVKRLKRYISKSPTGNLAYLVTKQYENFNENIKGNFRGLKNQIALSYHNQEQYQKALDHFDLTNGKIDDIILEHADCYVQLRRKSDARRFLVDNIPKLTNKDKANDAIELLTKLSTRSQAIANLRVLKEKTAKTLKDKVLWELAKRTKAKEDFTLVYTEFPKSFYAAESMSKVFWKEYKRKNYHKAIDIAKEHWKNYDYANSHAFVAFWSAKVELKLEQTDKAKEILHNLIIAHPRDYYSYRAKQILANDKKWYKLPSANNFTSFPSWKWPDIYDDGKIAEMYGGDILELTKLHEYRFLLDLEEKKEIEINKPFKMWLFAQDGDYLKAISTAYFSMSKDEPLNYKKAEFQYSYPLAYADLVTDEVSTNGKVDPMMVHALIKQESRYQKDIVSKAGAIGLMQLMPYTAKALARQMNIKPPRPYDLMQAPMNIKLGVRYMERVFGNFKNNMIQAIASYNAGPVAVKSWIKKWGEIDDPDTADEFIEKIPYDETKGYVKHVLNNYWLYKDLYS